MDMALHFHPEPGRVQHGMLDVVNTETVFDIIKTVPLVLKSCHLDILERNIAFFPGLAKNCFPVLIFEHLGYEGAWWCSLGQGRPGKQWARSTTNVVEKAALL